MCTWGERAQSRWLHPRCIRSPERVQEITPLGQCTAATVTQARAALGAPAVGTAASPGQAAEEHPEDVARESWAENDLPYHEFWQQTSWAMVLRQGRQTFVQVPDRLQGAVQTARGKALEVLAKA